MSFRPVLLAAALVALALPARAQETACTDGFAGEYPCRRVSLLANVSPQALGAPPAGQCAPPFRTTCAQDVWGWTDPQTGSEYAVVSLTNGTAFVDVSVPTAPRPLGRMPTATVSASWWDVKVIGNAALVVSEATSHGMQVFDLTRLRGLSADAGRLFTADARYTGIGSAHNVVVNEATGFAYAVGARTGTSGLPSSCNALGFHAINMADPLRPTFAGCFSNAGDGDPGFVIAPGYTHDAQCLIYGGPDADYRGRELCFAANEDEVTVFDVTDKSAVAVVSQIEYPNDRYTHQGWLTQDQRYFLVNDELDEVEGGERTQRTVVLDLEDLDNPGDVFVYDSGITSIDHNLYVRGRYAFESNYEAGLRILDLSQIATGTLTEAAYFDTYPSRTAIDEPCLPPNQTQQCDGFNGQWSNYPYFESGIVIANDSQRGLFVLRPDAALAVAAEDAPAATGYALSDPFPNPTADGARLTLRVDEPQHVRAEVFDVAGRRVAAVFSGAANGEVTLEVSGAGLPAGVYVVRVVGERFETSRRLVLTR